MGTGDFCGYWRLYEFSTDDFAKGMMFEQLGLKVQSTLVISKSKGHFEISVLRHIRCAKLRKIPIEQPSFSNEHVI